MRNYCENYGTLGTIYNNLNYAKQTYKRITLLFQR